MNTADYKIGMLEKQQLYQQEGKRVISLYPADKPRLDSVLRAKLALFGFTIPPDRPPTGVDHCTPPDASDRYPQNPGVGERE